MLALPRVNPPLALDGLWWRRLAALGACRAPAAFVRWAPPFIGVAIAVAAPRARRRIARQLERARGPVGLLRESVDTARTFANFASCLTEVLATGSKNGREPVAVVHGQHHLDAALGAKRGVLLATAHTAGWERVGPLLARDERVHVTIVVQSERDGSAGELSDSRRRAHGRVEVFHAGGYPLAALPLLGRLREGGVVAIQLDRVPTGMGGRPVRLFGRTAAIPEGPLRLAQLTGAPIVPVFSARLGPNRYAVFIRESVSLSRRAAPPELDAAAQRLADALGTFVSAHATQWFAFQE